MAKLIDNRQKNDKPMDKKQVMINALFNEFSEEAPIVEPNPNKVQFIPISQIKGSERNMFFNQDDKAFILAKNIANNGLYEKPQVFIIENKELNDQGIYYEVSAGNTRTRAWRIAYQMAKDGTLIEHLKLNSDEIKRGVTLESKMNNIAKTFDKIPVFVYGSAKDVQNAVHKETNLFARDIQSLEYIVNAPTMDTPEEQAEAYRYLFGDEKTDSIIAQGKEIKLSTSQKAEYLVKYYKEEYAKDLNASTLRKYISAYDNSCSELIMAVFDGKISVRDYLYQVSKCDYEMQRKIVDAYGTPEYDELIKAISKTTDEEKNDEKDPMKDLEKMIKKYYSLCNEEIVEIESNLKKLKPTANTKEVIKKIKKIQKQIIELNEMPLK